jgi:hypothetical protein
MAPILDKILDAIFIVDDNYIEYKKKGYPPHRYPQYKYKKFSNMVSGTGWGASIGGILGALIGGFIGSAGGPAGTIGGAWTGAKLGAGIGGMIGAFTGGSSAFSKDEENSIKSNYAKQIFNDVVNTSEFTGEYKKLTGKDYKPGSEISSGDYLRVLARLSNSGDLKFKNAYDHYVSNSTSYKWLTDKSKLDEVESELQHKHKLTEYSKKYYDKLESDTKSTAELTKIRKDRKYLIELQKSGNLSDRHKFNEFINSYNFKDIGYDQERLRNEHKNATYIMSLFDKFNEETWKDPYKDKPYQTSEGRLLYSSDEVDKYATKMSEVNNGILRMIAAQLDNIRSDIRYRDASNLSEFNNTVISDRRTSFKDEVGAVGANIVLGKSKIGGL